MKRASQVAAEAESPTRLENWPALYQVARRAVHAIKGKNCDLYYFLEWNVGQHAL
jgi:hypothetical protein